ncbi:cyclase family protein [Thalassospira alkalitolerans]|uniref:cyclase family protein n=1 Tax=Thalassospira alkalitolerans TaxID=1293890 RepID=UPI003AA990C0
MHKSKILIAASVILGMTSATAVQAEDRFASKFGPEDQIGAANNLSADTTLAASKLISTGKVYSLGMVISRETPAFAPRGVAVTVFSPSQSGNKTIGSNSGTYNDDMFTGWLGVGTQIDGLGHLGDHHTYYNNNHAEDFVLATGLTKLGIENVPPMATRGVLLDIAAIKGTDRLEGGYVISLDDVMKAQKAAGTEIRKGDVVLFHTGWLDLVGKDDGLYGRIEPGVGLEAAAWLADKGVVAVGADTWGLEAVPHEDPDAFFPVHVKLLAENGVYILENIVTRDLAADGAHEFLFVLGQAKLKGAVQMIINPVAVR